MYRYRTGALALAALLAATLGVAGCSASTPSPTGAPSTPSAASSPISKSLKRADLCDTLPVAQVAAITGLPLTYSINVPAKKPIDIVECLYADAAKGSDRVHQISIDVAYGGGAATLKEITSQVTFDQKSLGPVAGIGDAARASDDGFAVQYGNDVVCAVDSFEDTLLPRDTLKKLIVTMHDRLA